MLIVAAMLLVGGIGIMDGTTSVTKYDDELLWLLLDTWWQDEDDFGDW
jgi:hypothetical protein